MEFDVDGRKEKGGTAGEKEERGRAEERRSWKKKVKGGRARVRTVRPHLKI